MLENMTGALSRIDEIKSNFSAPTAHGRVNVAPHAASTGAPQPLSMGASFSEYLQKATEPGDTSVGGSASAYDDIIETSAQKYGLDPALVKGVIKAESSFNPNVVSHAGAQGLMQLMPGTAQGLGVSNPFDPAQNVEGGVRYLKSQMDRFGDVKMALAAYNAGPGAVAKYGGVPPYRETQNYVNKVLSYRDGYLR